MTSAEYTPYSYVYHFIHKTNLHSQRLMRTGNFKLTDVDSHKTSQIGCHKNDPLDLHGNSYVASVLAVVDLSAALFSLFVITFFSLNGIEASMKAADQPD